MCEWFANVRFLYSLPRARIIYYTHTAGRLSINFPDTHLKTHKNGQPVFTGNYFLFSPPYTIGATELHHTFFFFHYYSS